MFSWLQILEVFFFFFQAEDGIRDVAVTGVQTCALPISAVSRSHNGRQLPRSPAHAWLLRAARSEERRVGKSVDPGSRVMMKILTLSCLENNCQDEHPPNNMFECL